MAILTKKVSALEAGDKIHVDGEVLTVREVTNRGCDKDHLQIRVRHHSPLRAAWDASVIVEEPSA